MERRGARLRPASLTKRDVCLRGADPADSRLDDVPQREVLRRHAGEVEALATGQRQEDAGHGEPKRNDPGACFPHN